MAHRDTSNTEPGHRRLSGLWLILDESNRALVVQPSYREPGRYQLVGGGAQPDEPPHIAAVREGQEEIGLTMFPDKLLIADYVTRNPNTGTVEGTNLIFLHRLRPGDKLILNAGGTAALEPELASFRFATADQLDALCAPYQALRIREAMAAAADPSLRGYRVEGERVGAAA